MRKERGSAIEREVYFTNKGGGSVNSTIKKEI